MPGDSYLTDNGRQSSQLTYDPSTKKWVASAGASTSSGNLSTTKATPQNTSSSAVSEKSTSQTNTKSAADKEYIENEYNTLQGDLSVVPCSDTMKIKPGDTIFLHGVGTFLSGLYFVSEKRSELSSDGFTITLTVIKTGFGDSLKSPYSQDAVPVESSRPDEIQKTVSVFKANDSVKIMGDDAKYYTAKGDIKIPAWVKQNTHTVKTVSSDNTRVLLQEINSWVYTKYIQKA